MAIDAAGAVRGFAEAGLPGSFEYAGGLCQRPEDWWAGIHAALDKLAAHCELGAVASLAVDSTSGTLLLADRNGMPRGPALMYNDRRPTEIAQEIARAAGTTTPAVSASGSLAKLVWWTREGITGGAEYALHAADWLAGKFTGQYGRTDYHNALKLGYDCETLNWPSWINKLEIDLDLLPEVDTPGAARGTIAPAVARELGLPSSLQIRAGTTDSVAAFLATGADRIGDGVTVLGSTLVLKLLTGRPVSAPESGVYSHRLGSMWLAGGASNSGGSALAKYFTVPEINKLESLLRVNSPTNLDYYPLPATGERFPVDDPGMTSRVEPVPTDRAIFLQGLLEGIAKIEKRGYDLLASLGAPAVQRIFTTGGGARNQAWTAIRRRILGIPFASPRSEQSAYGAARLAAGCLATGFEPHAG